MDQKRSILEILKNSSDGNIREWLEAREIDAAEIHSIVHEMTRQAIPPGEGRQQMFQCGFMTGFEAGFELSRDRYGDPGIHS